MFNLVNLIIHFVQLGNGSRFDYILVVDLPKVERYRF